jgi:hypothetical protein
MGNEFDDTLTDQIKVIADAASKESHIDWRWALVFVMGEDGKPLLNSTVFPSSSAIPSSASAAPLRQPA